MPRKKTVGQRIGSLIFAPQLPRSKRNQRVAIIAMVVLLGVYLLVSPMLGDMFGGSRKDAPPAAAAPTKGLGKKK